MKMMLSEQRWSKGSLSSALGFLPTWLGLSCTLFHALELGLMGRPLWSTGACHCMIQALIIRLAYESLIIASGKVDWLTQQFNEEITVLIE